VTAVEILPTTLVTYNDGYAVSAPSGTFAANAVGVYDLGGNVAEWVQDFYAIDSVETAERSDDPLGPEIGRFHGVRGASWRSATVTDLRAAYRNYGAEGREDVGFRIARNLQSWSRCHECHSNSACRRRARNTGRIVARAGESGAARYAGGRGCNADTNTPAAGTRERRRIYSDSGTAG
jgi:hypothetical protein